MQSSLQRLAALFSAAAASICTAASASVFNLPAGQTSLQLVTVGDPGNAADTRVDQLDGTSGYGSVNYFYQIGKYEVTTAQYSAFLNSVATTADPYALYNSKMATTTAGTYGCGITVAGNAPNLSYSVIPGRENLPVNWVSWGDEARFVNWLSNGQPATGVEDSTTTEAGSYNLAGATTSSQLQAIHRNANATYVIPSENEWYKAGFYKGGSTNAGYWLYATQSNSDPSNVLNPAGNNNANFYTGTYSNPATYLTNVGAFAGSSSAYGTYDQDGNVWESSEAIVSSVERGLRGGSFNQIVSNLRADNRSELGPTTENFNDGFRIADLVVPEPSSLSVLIIGLATISWRKNHDKRFFLGY